MGKFRGSFGTVGAFDLGNPGGRCQQSPRAAIASGKRRYRKRGYATESKTFQTKARAERWARAVQPETDRGIFLSTFTAEETTTTSASCTKAALWPMWIEAPSSFRRVVDGFAGVEPRKLQFALRHAADRCAHREAAARRVDVPESLGECQTTQRDGARPPVEVGHLCHREAATLR